MTDDLLDIYLKAIYLSSDTIMSNNFTEVPSTR